LESFKKFSESNKMGSILNPIYKLFLFILLLPKYLISVLRPGKIEKLINEGEVLIEYYKSPIIQVRRLKLICEGEKSVYEGGLIVIKDQLNEQ
jgi:hypothetical protein